MPGKPPTRTPKAVEVEPGSATSGPPRDTDSEVAVVINGVNKHFGSVHALQGLNARIRYGRLTGLVGPDGAGKTTLMRILTGLLAPNSGHAVVAGFDVVAAPGLFVATEQLGLFEKFFAKAPQDRAAVDERVVNHQGRQP